MPYINDYDAQGMRMRLRWHAGMLPWHVFKPYQASFMHRGRHYQAWPAACLVLEVLALALPHAWRLRPRQFCLRLQLLLLQAPHNRLS